MSKRSQDLAQAARAKLDAFYDELDHYKTLKSQWNSSAISLNVFNLYRVVSKVSSDSTVMTSRNCESLKSIRQAILGEIDQVQEVLSRQYPAVAQKLVSCLNSALGNSAQLVACGSSIQKSAQSTPSPERVIVDFQSMVEQLQAELANQKEICESLKKHNSGIETECMQLKKERDEALADLAGAENALSITALKFHELEEHTILLKQQLLTLETRAKELPLRFDEEWRKIRSQDFQREEENEVLLGAPLGHNIVEKQNPNDGEQRRFVESELENRIDSGTSTYNVLIRKVMIATTQLEKLRDELKTVYALSKSTSTIERKKLGGKLVIFQKHMDTLMSGLIEAGGSSDYKPQEEVVGIDWTVVVGVEKKDEVISPPTVESDEDDIDWKSVVAGRTHSPKEVAENTETISSEQELAQIAMTERDTFEWKDIVEGKS